MNMVPPPPVQRAFDQSDAPAAKRARDASTPCQVDGRSGKKRQTEPPVSLTQVAGGHAHNSSAQSSLLLCLHALTHCTDQLKQQDAAPSQEDVQLLADIAVAAGRLQRLARQRLQSTQTSAADWEQPTRQEPDQHVVGQRQLSNPQQVHSHQALVQEQQQQEVRAQLPQVRSPASQSTSKQQQHQAIKQGCIQVKEKPCVVGAEALPHQQQQQQQRPQPKAPKQQQQPAHRQQSVQLPRVQQDTITAAWHIDKQPFAVGASQHAGTTAHSSAPEDSTTRAAAALEAALAAAAADACAGQGEVDSSTQQQKAPPPAVHLPALRPASQLPRDRLKNLATTIRSQSTAVTDEPAALRAKPLAAGTSRQQAGPGHAPAAVAGAASTKYMVNGAKSAAAKSTDGLSSDSGGSRPATSTPASGSSTGSSSGDSSSSSDDSSSDSDSDAELPLTELQERHTPKQQKQKPHKRPVVDAAACTSQAAPSTAAAAEGPQQCLICRQAFPAARLISSKLFCSCKGCLAAAVSRGSSRGYRVAQCPKRGCNAMVVKLGKSGWHTGDSGQAHYVEVDSKTGLFRIGYSRKRSSKKRGARKGVRKSGKGGSKRSGES